MSLNQAPEATDFPGSHIIFEKNPGSSVSASWVMTNTGDIEGFARLVLLVQGLTPHQFNGPRLAIPVGNFIIAHTWENIPFVEGGTYPCSIVIQRFKDLVGQTFLGSWTHNFSIFTADRTDGSVPILTESGDPTITMVTLGAEPPPVSPGTGPLLSGGLHPNIL